MQTNPILFIQAGGTIDKDYIDSSENHGYNFLVGEPAFVIIMKRARIQFEYRQQTVCQKDSLDMNDEDRQSILVAVQGAPEERIIIGHGTDTMHTTAEVLAEVAYKTIVLTGSMIPERFRDSDADFNIGMAVGAMGYLQPGVYIALNGQVMPWDEYQP